MDKRQTVIAINGSALSGKDTFIKQMFGIIKQHRPDALVANKSSIDPVKEAMRQHLFWSGCSKEEKDRALMADIKAAWDKHYNGTFIYCRGQVESFFTCQKALLMFLHIREPGNIHRLRDAYLDRINFLTLLVRTDRDVQTFNNDADRGVDNMHYDVTVDNTGSEADLWRQAYAVSKRILLPKLHG